MYGAEVATEAGPELPLAVVEPEALDHLVQAEADVHTGVPGVRTIMLMKMTMTMTTTTMSMSMTMTMMMKNIAI